VTPPIIVSVILPTVAVASRAACLDRALESVLTQAGVRVDPIVVANGPDCDADLIDALLRRRDIRVLRRREAGLGAAIAAGREIVEAPYFTELDDDDLFLPGALAARVATMEADPTIDATVTSGYLRSARGDVLNVPGISRCAQDPLRAIIDRMWLTPGAGLFRSATIPATYFSGMPPHLEWTYLAVRLALERRMAFLDTPTFVYNADTPDSLSKSRELQAVLRMALPPDVRRALRRKYVAALHGASVKDLEQGRKADAWKWHLRTLFHVYGWRYLAYTRHLFV
jgi:glycosyltransferase involved in cell wall biosynthesis